MHEAGHAVVARFFGVPVIDARIYPSPIPKAARARGIVRANTWDGVVRHDGAQRDVQRRIAVAGCVAEAIWRRRPFNGDANANALFEFVSASDRRSAGVRRGAPNGWLSAVLSEVFDLLRRDGPLWHELLREARRLMLATREQGS